MSRFDSRAHVLALGLVDFPLEVVLVPDEDNLAALRNKLRPVRDRVERRENGLVEDDHGELRQPEEVLRARPIGLLAGEVPNCDGPGGTGGEPDWERVTVDGDGRLRVRLRGLEDRADERCFAGGDVPAEAHAEAVAGHLKM